jgi:sortase A
MRRAPFLLTAAGVLILLASIPATGLGRSSAPPVASSRSIMAIASSTTSPSASATAPATPQPTDSERNAAAVAAAAPVTAVIARISIPRIGLRNAPIYDRGTDAKGVMLIAPGYAVTRYAFSASFGSGNTVIYGHDDIQGNIFGHLYDLRPGDKVEIAVAGETQTYHVTGYQIVLPTDVGVLNATSDVRLTIITCWPFNVDTKRWIVTAVEG